jgi:hypothetical protein
MWKSCNLGKTFELISGLIAMSIFSALISIPFKLLDYVFKKIEIHDSDILEYASNTILDFPDISKNIDIALTCLILISVVIILFVLVSYVFNKKVFFLLNLFWVFLPLVIFDSIYLFYTDSTLFFLILNFPAVSTIIDLWLTVIFLASIGLSAISFHPKATETTLVKNLYNSGKTIFSVNIFSYIIIYVGIIAFYYGKKFLIYLGSLSAEIFLYGIIFIFLLIAVVFILAMLYETLLKLDFFIKLTGIDNNHSGDNFHNSSPEFQIYYLNNIINKKLKHSSLQDYEEELIKLEDNIKDQEVLDIYWAKRAEIQALIKQSRME